VFHRLIGGIHEDLSEFFQAWRVAWSNSRPKVILSTKCSVSSKLMLWLPSINSDYVSRVRHFHASSLSPSTR
jgi:hypothetical protein